ncbi:hypothetical protein [Thalassobacillus sp. CUG 92003]|uniref:hypothetical protein n=1 Tax=Thalassobacillus sp. CUG 92003 TaxID=2736641 RepID=UPI0015E77A4D|nr:hypothetical protein [Thalassobacillus sp. CUG 92003]
MGRNKGTHVISTQEERPIELPLDGTSVELLRLSVPEQLHGHSLKLDGFFQSNFFVIECDDLEVEQTALPYKYEIAFQVMTEADEGLFVVPATPILRDSVIGVQQPVEFSVEHNTSPNFTVTLPCVDSDIVVMAWVSEVQGGVAGAFVNARSINGTVF